MKKVHFGIMLFLLGAIGFLVLSLYLSANPYIYNGTTGLYATLLGNDLLLPYIIFCTMGIAGFIICAYETYFRKPQIS